MLEIVIAIVASIFLLLLLTFAITSTMIILGNLFEPLDPDLDPNGDLFLSNTTTKKESENH